jgi:hypothetical protein
MMRMTQQIPVWWGKHRQSFEQKADDTFGETFELFVGEFWLPSKAACWRPDRSERSGSVGKVWRGLAGPWIGAGEGLEEGRLKNHRSSLKWLQNEMKVRIKLILMNSEWLQNEIQKNIVYTVRIELIFMNSKWLQNESQNKVVYTVRIKLILMNSKWLQNESQNKVVYTVAYRDRFGIEANWYLYPTDYNKQISFNVFFRYKSETCDLSNGINLILLADRVMNSTSFPRIQIASNQISQLPSWFENGLPALGRSGVGGQKTFFEIGSHTMFPSLGSLWESSRRHFPSESKKKKNVGIPKTNFKVELEDIFPLKTTKKM